MSDFSGGASKQWTGVKKEHTGELPSCSSVLAPRVPCFGLVETRQCLHKQKPGDLGRVCDVMCCNVLA